MKVLYLGYYRDGTGWAKAAQNYILALDSVGIDVVPRYVKLNSIDAEVDEKIVELESHTDKNCDVVIQHLLPHHMDFNGNFDKNIALYVTETDSCKNTFWPERINLMDEAWVPNKFMAEHTCLNSKINIPHKVVPHAFDMSKYERGYDKLSVPETEGKFCFYYIGDFSRRKNIGCLLKAFHLEFEPNEKVSIVLKCNCPGLRPDELEEKMTSLCSEVKKGLKLYGGKTEMYHKEIFVCDYMSEENIMNMHNSFDCFVSASFGEAWGIPIFDAMAMGKTPICTDSHGPSFFLDGGGYLIESYQENCFGVTDTFEELYVGNENWSVPKVSGLRKCMREAFENEEGRKAKASAGINNAYKYSLQSVGAKMKDILLGVDKEQTFNENSQNIINHSIGKTLR